MITGELKSQIDKVWEAFWTGGLSNPLTVIEQMTYLLFIRRLDELQTQKENKATITKKPIEDPIYNTSEYELRWSRFKDFDPEVMHKLFTKQDGVFDFLRNIGNRSAAFSKFMKGATFMIPTPRLLAQVVVESHPCFKVLEKKRNSFGMKTKLFVHILLMQQKLKKS